MCHYIFEKGCHNDDRFKAEGGEMGASAAAPGKENTATGSELMEQMCNVGVKQEQV